jgi:hypothetical protein
LCLEVRVGKHSQREAARLDAGDAAGAK